MSFTPLAFSPALPSELLTYLLSNGSYPTTLIVCQPRESISMFDSASLAHDWLQIPGFLSTVVESLKETSLTSSLLQTTLSRNINIIYVTNVVGLRCLLTSIESEDQSSRSLTRLEIKDKPKKSFLVAYGLVELHRNTSYWSQWLLKGAALRCLLTRLGASGISDCLSILVEAGHRGHLQILLFEEKKHNANNWTESAPLLSQRNLENLVSAPLNKLLNIKTDCWKLPSPVQAMLLTILIADSYRVQKAAHQAAL